MMRRKIVELLAISLLFYHAGLLKAESGTLAGRPVRIQLAKGLTLLYFQDASSESTHLYVLVPGGKSAAPADKASLSFLVSRLALEIPDAGDSRKMVKLGSTYRCEVFGDFSLLSAHALSRDFEETLTIFASGIADPLFSGLRISFIKEQLDFFRQNEEDNPAQNSEQLHLFHFFGQGGYGISVFGTPESVKKISKKDLSAFHQSFFNTASILVAVVSDLPQEKITAMLERAFRSLPSVPKKGIAQAPAAIPVPAPLQKRMLHLQKEKQQTSISLALLLPGFSVEQHALGLLAESLLGKGMGSRLWRIRSRNRLAYNIQARLLSMRHGGILRVSLRVSSDRLEEALTALNREIDELYLQGIGEDEWQMTRKVAVNDYWQEVENRGKMAFYMGYFEYLGAGFAMAAEFPRQFDQVSLKEFNDFLRKILDAGNRSLVTVGPALAVSSN